MTNLDAFRRLTGLSLQNGFRLFDQIALRRMPKTLAPLDADTPQHIGPSCRHTRIKASRPRWDAPQHWHK
ncbi:MAG: DUF1127 domain-containing protein [Cognatishimia sp.]